MWNSLYIYIAVHIIYHGVEMGRVKREGLRVSMTRLLYFTRIISLRHINDVLNVESLHLTTLNLVR